MSRCWRGVVVSSALLVLASPGAAAETAKRPEVVFRFDEQITESSGLVDLGRRVLTVNDSGDDAIVYAVDPGSGATVGRTTYADEVADVEALTVGPGGDLWVGDIGDNSRTRTSVRVHRLDGVPSGTQSGDRRVEATTYDLVYRGGPRDAETLLLSPRGRLHVVSKGLLGGEVYQAPRVLREDQPNVLRPVADVGGQITDGAWFPDGRHVVLRDYRDAFVYDTTDDWRYVGRVPLPPQQQGEGLAVRPDGSLLVSSEGKRQPVLEVPLPSELAAAMRPASEDAATPEVVDDRAGGRWRFLVAAALGAVLVGVVASRFLRLSPRQR